MISEAMWNPQLVLPLRERIPKDPLLHWVSIWFAAKILLEDASEHPAHWKIKYDGYKKKEVMKIKDDAEKQWRDLWGNREDSPNLEAVKEALNRFVRYGEDFIPPEGL